MEMVLICKSALPWAGGVKVGEGGRKTEGTRARDRHRRDAHEKSVNYTEEGRNERYITVFVYRSKEN